MKTSSEFQPTQGVCYKKLVQKERSIFFCFLRQDQAEVDVFFAALYVWHEGFRELILGGTVYQRGRKRPSFLNSLGVIIVRANSLFLLGHR
jgi:hypothetical protein